MKELSLHVLDLVENSIKAKAKLVKITVIEDLASNFLKIIIEDNGEGMEESLLNVVDNPFTTTRKNQKCWTWIITYESCSFKSWWRFRYFFPKR